MWAELGRQQRIHGNRNATPEEREEAWQKIQKIERAMQMMREQGYESWQTFQKWEQERYEDVGIPRRDPDTLDRIWNADE